MSEEGNLVEIQTRSGRLRGKHFGEVTVFKGIPYAMPPTGTHRFQAPRPVKPWNGPVTPSNLDQQQFRPYPGG